MNPSTFEQPIDNFNRLLQLNLYTVMGLSIMYGAAIPLFTKNIRSAFQKQRFLHLSNVVHNLLFLGISGITILFRLQEPPDCFFFRKVQAIMFNLYVLSYEFVLAYKAKGILGRKTVFLNISWAGLLFTLSVLLRVAISVGNIMTTQVRWTTPFQGTCSNYYDPIWINVSNYSRNFLDFIWSMLFVVPIYYVLVSSVHGRFYVKVNDMAYKRIFIANCAYPLIAIMISTAISISMNIKPTHWNTLLFGVQNFVSSYSINLILNVKVEGRAIRSRFNNDEEQTEEDSNDDVNVFGNDSTTFSAYSDDVMKQSYNGPIAPTTQRNYSSSAINRPSFPPRPITDDHNIDISQIQTDAVHRKSMSGSPNYSELQRNSVMLKQHHDRRSFAGHPPPSNLQRYRSDSRPKFGARVSSRQSQQSQYLQNNSINNSMNYPTKPKNTNHYPADKSNSLKDHSSSILSPGLLDNTSPSYFSNVISNQSTKRPSQMEIVHPPPPTHQLPQHEFSIFASSNNNNNNVKSDTFSKRNSKVVVKESNS